MKARLGVALVVALSLALMAGVAYAQGANNDRVCFGGANGNVVLDSGAVARNMILFGCNGTVRAGATVQGDASVFGGNLIVEQGARVGRDIAILGGNADVASEVGSDISVVGGVLTLRDSAVVNGRVRVLGGSVKQADGAVVRGGTSQENGLRSFPSWPFFSPAYGRAFNIDFGWGRWILTGLALAVLGALLVALAPLPVQRVADAAFTQTLPAAGTGCLTVLIAPVLGIAFAITIVGIPITLLLLLACVIAWYFGWIAVGYLAGQRVLEALKVRDIAPVLAVVVGVILLAIVGELPCIGGIVSLLIGTLGLGAVILTRFGTQLYPPAPHFGAPWPPAAPLAPLAPLPPTPPVNPSPDVMPRTESPAGPLAPLPPLPPMPPAPPQAPLAPEPSTPPAGSLPDSPPAPDPQTPSG